MAGGRFAVTIEEGEELRETGHDTATFLFSANAGVAPADIARIEIDTGISGRTAQKVSEKMAKLSRTRQVIAITHLPQIAACGGQHLLVYKESTEDRTFTNIKELDMPEREQMIATMMSGESRTESAVATAREMLKSSQVNINQPNTL